MPPDNRRRHCPAERRPQGGWLGVAQSPRNPWLGASPRARVARRERKQGDWRPFEGSERVTAPPEQRGEPIFNMFKLHGRGGRRGAALRRGDQSSLKRALWNGDRERMAWRPGLRCVVGRRRPPRRPAVGREGRIGGLSGARPPGPPPAAHDRGRALPSTFLLRHIGRPASGSDSELAEGIRVRRGWCEHARGEKRTTITAEDSLMQYRRRCARRERERDR